MSGVTLAQELPWIEPRIFMIEINHKRIDLLHYKPITAF